MFDAKKLLDAVVGAVAKPGAATGPVAETLARVLGQATQGLGQGASRLDAATGSMGKGATDAVRSGPAGGAIASASAYLRANPALTQAALTGVAGLLVRSRRARGVAMNAAAVGGLALIGGLAYQAFQNARSGRAAPGAAPGLDAFPNADDTGPGLPAGATVTGGTAGGEAPASAASPQIASASSQPMPDGTEIARAAPDTRDISDDDALLLVRAMVAAASADGIVDQGERSRIISGLQQAGLDPDATRFLETELASPADVEELAAGVTDPDKAAQIYTAARLAIDPDTLQEREFLRRLQEALDLDDELVAQLDAAAASVKGE